MKKIIVLAGLMLLFVYAYYDGGIGTYQPGRFRLAYTNINFENANDFDASQKLLSSSADVILVEEWTGKNLDTIGILSSGYKVVVDAPARGTHGAVLFARKGLSITGERVKSPYTGPCSIPILTASLLFKGELITLLGVHAPPPVKACKGGTDQAISDFAGLVEDGRLSRNFGAGRKGDPVILLGDFNTLPINSSLQSITTSGLMDTHGAVGQFLGSSWSPWPVLPKLLRIDYMFYSPSLKPIGMWNTRLPGSDHSLLVSDYVWAK